MRSRTGPSVGIVSVYNLKALAWYLLKIIGASPVVSVAAKPSATVAKRRAFSAVNSTYIIAILKPPML